MSPLTVLLHGGPCDGTYHTIVDEWSAIEIFRPPSMPTNCTDDTAPVKPKLWGSYVRMKFKGKYHRYWREAWPGA